MSDKLPEIKIPQPVIVNSISWSDLWLVIDPLVILKLVVIATFIGIMD